MPPLPAERRGARVDALSLHLLAVPLSTPYRLSFTSVERFDTVLVECQAGGHRGFGEATLLTGYTHETVEQSWRLACASAQRIVGTDATTALAGLAALSASAPFTATALASAVEMACAHPLLERAAPARVPLLALLHAEDAAGLDAEVGRHVDAGISTFKVKVGFDVDGDLARVAAVRRALRGRGTMRIDANQGYSTEQACRFAARVGAESVELLEQPCAAGDWQAAAAVARVSSVPLMLDEGIYDAADIERAAELEVCRYVKLKLMKLGSLDALAAGLARIRELGMVPVLGNGVACDPGCWMEACVARTGIDNAGEMNGFLKTTAALFASPIEVRDGAIELAPGPAPELDRDALARFSRARREFEAAAPAAAAGD